MREVTILSVYGRGFWIASELRRRNIKVKIIDFTDQFKAWKPEDLRNPVGAFFNGYFSDTQLARMHMEDDFTHQEGGLCVWTSDGPVHFKSNLVNYYLSDTKNRESVEEILKPKDEEVRAKSKLKKVMEKLAPFEFDEDLKESWILKLSQQLGCLLYTSPSPRDATLSRMPSSA